MQYAFGHAEVIIPTIRLLDYICLTRSRRSSICFFGLLVFIKRMLLRRLLSRSQDKLIEFRRYNPLVGYVYYRQC